MRTTISLVVLLGLVSGTTLAGPVQDAGTWGYTDGRTITSARTVRSFCQVITDLETVLVPVLTQVKVDPKEVKEVAVAEVRGREYVDGTGRRWTLVDGVPFKEKPARLCGKFCRTNNGRVVLFTDTGHLFIESLPKPVEQPKAP